MRVKIFLNKARNYLYFTKKTKIFNSKTRAKRILYFGIPMHPNLGDQAQKYCIRNWIQEYYSDYDVLEIPTRIVVDNRFKFLDILKKNVRKTDIFIFQSGYCTHDIEPSKEDLMHRIVIKNFPENRMLMLPQTVYFQSEERRRASSEIYNLADNMLFLARDAVSYEMAKNMFDKLKIELYPDIVTTLIGTKKYTNNREGIFLCVRRDCEKYYSDEDIEKLIHKLQSICEVYRGDTTLDDCDPYWLDKHLEEKLDDVLKQYAKYRVIITDRYHGTIFSIIAGTPVIVIKTQDHKVSTGVDWFKGIYDGVYFANDLEEAHEYAEKLLADKRCFNPSPYFKEKYYDHLKERFDEKILDQDFAQN